MVVIPVLKSSLKKEFSLNEIQMLEIGNVYRKRGRLYLAVDHFLMITYSNGVLKEVKPSIGLMTQRTLSVGFLLGEWNITTVVLDQITAFYLSPSLHRDMSKRLRRSKRRGGEHEELEIFREIRMHKLYSRHKST